MEETKGNDYSIDSGRMNQTNEKLNMRSHYKNRHEANDFSESIFYDDPKRAKKIKEPKTMRRGKMYKEDQYIESMATDDNEFKNPRSTESRYKKNSGTIDTDHHKPLTENNLIKYVFYLPYSPNFNNIG
jgi:hypothetical protein